MNYKAKRSDGKGWVEGYLTPMYNAGYKGECDRVCIHSGILSVFEVIPETICQFTGETATTALEGIDPKIWNGDIFEFETLFRTTRRLKVVYKNAAFYAVMIDDEEIGYLLSDFLDDTVNCKVGNIYDEN